MPRPSNSAPRVCWQNNTNRSTNTIIYTTPKAIIIVYHFFLFPWKSILCPLQFDSVVLYQLSFLFYTSLLFHTPACRCTYSCKLAPHIQHAFCAMPVCLSYLLVPGKWAMYSACSLQYTHNMVSNSKLLPFLQVSQLLFLCVQLLFKHFHWPTQWIAPLRERLDNVPEVSTAWCTQQSQIVQHYLSFRLKSPPLGFWFSWISACSSLRWALSSLRLKKLAPFLQLLVGHS